MEKAPEIRSDFGRYAAYARAHGHSSVDQMTADRLEFGEVHTLAGFVGWLTLKRAQYEVQFGITVDSPEVIRSFDLWLAKEAR